MNYNFKKKETRQAAIYRLFIRYKKGSEWYKKAGAKKTYYGYFHKYDKGRNKLMEIFFERMAQIKFAILYNTKTGKKQTLKHENDEKKNNSDIAPMASGK